jgi:tripartite-type tricarboxylate transporter receptor subunit TctC
MTRSPHSMLRRTLLATAVLCASVAAGAQSWPTKPVTLMVPFAPGGSVDQAGRLMADSLTRILGQPFVVDNRPGAAGNIAYAMVARAPKDGSSVLVTYSATTSCSPALYHKLNWDPVKDLTPVGMVMVSSVVFAVPASLPVNTLPEFVAYLKQHPGELNFGSSGIGSQAHIVGEMFQQETGTKIVHVPFKGSGDLMPSLLSGRIQMAVATPSAVLPFLQAGKLKALAVTSSSRDPILPQVPTATELGIPVVNEGWIGLALPAGTPSQVISRLSVALKSMTDSPEFRQHAKAAGLEVQYLAPEATAARVRKDIADCGTAVRQAGITLD